ncbi:MAG TPA: response regulator [Actinomycetota bacterium]|nr:response regulator [Actinomycetota bacterium]
MIPRHPRVLIVEDEPDTLLVLRINLDAAGFVTSLAADGATALGRIEEERPDVVLLDLMLPVVDGWSVLADLRSRPAAPRVVVCSAKGSERDFAQAEEMGAAAYVTKPFVLEDVVAALWEALIRPAPAWEPNREPGLLPGWEG